MWSTSIANSTNVEERVGHCIFVGPVQLWYSMLSSSPIEISDTSVWAPEIEDTSDTKSIAESSRWRKGIRLEDSDWDSCCDAIPEEPDGSDETDNTMLSKFSFT